jgi:hypothetical protein
MNAVTLFGDCGSWQSRGNGDGEMKEEVENETGWKEIEEGVKLDGKGGSLDVESGDICEGEGKWGGLID